MDLFLHSETSYEQLTQLIGPGCKMQSWDICISEAENILRWLDDSERRARFKQGEKQEYQDFSIGEMRGLGRVWSILTLTEKGFRMHQKLPLLETTRVTDGFNKRLGTTAQFSLFPFLIIWVPFAAIIMAKNDRNRNWYDEERLYRVIDIAKCVLAVIFSPLLIAAGIITLVLGAIAAAVQTLFFAFEYSIAAINDRNNPSPASASQMGLPNSIQPVMPGPQSEQNPTSTERPQSPRSNNAVNATKLKQAPIVNKGLFLEPTSQAAAPKQPFTSIFKPSA